MNLDTIQRDIESLPPDAQQIVIDLVQILKQRYSSITLESKPDQPPEDWSDFIGCMDAEPDLSTHYKSYLKDELEQKHGHRWQRILACPR